MTDGYSAYDAPAREAGIRHATCMAHVWREFHDVLKADRTNSRASEAMTLIGKLYGLESKCAHATPADRLEAQQTALILAAFRTWLHQTGADITPNSALAQAVSYVINSLDGLGTVSRSGYTLGQFAAVSAIPRLRRNNRHPQGPPISAIYQDGVQVV